MEGLAITITKDCSNCGDQHGRDCKQENIPSCWLADASVHDRLAKFFDEHAEAASFKITPIYHVQMPVPDEAHTPCNPVPDTLNGQGVKYDDGKPRFDLIPPEVMFGMAELYRLGAKKYADRNWEKGLLFMRTFAAMQRHAWAWAMGQDYAPDDGQHHMLSVAWCAFVIFTFFIRGQDEPLDDRPVTPALPADAISFAINKN